MLRLIPDNTNIDFVRLRWIAFSVTIVLSLIAVVSLGLQGLNLGIDFKGGSLFEVSAGEGKSTDIAPLRKLMSAQNLGEVQIQAITDLTNPKAGTFQIRVQSQPDDKTPADKSSNAKLCDSMSPGPEKAQCKAVEKIETALKDAGYVIRKTDSVGSRVGEELMSQGLWATLLAMAMIGAYIWFRFEWQFAIAATVCTLHDVLMAFGFYSLTREDFDLVAVAAILMLAGYSVNDTVVVFDRIRETLRRNRKPEIKQVINEAVNVTLGRTALTSLTVLLSLIALIIFGGPVLYNFSLVLAFGVLIGTYSSIFVAACLLIYLPLPRRTTLDEKLAAEATGP